MVQAFQRVLVLAEEGAGQAEDADVLAALPPVFSSEPAGRQHRIRRTWLDTFDWRLYRAGLTLQHITGSGPGQLVLTGPGGEIDCQQAGRISWPALAACLPTGPVQDRLASLAGVRALLPAARAVSTVRDFRVLNADTKTIAWIRVDRPSVTYPAPADVPAELTVTSVRGYQGQTERIAQLLATVPGVNSHAPKALETALAAAGQRPGDYSSKINFALKPGMPARAAMKSVLLRLLDTLEANVSGTIRDTDTEFLHDLRVAVRRTRSALKLTGDVLPAGVRDRFGPEFKWLGDLTTPSRDLDVYTLNYDAMAAGLLAATPAELEPFRTHLVSQRAKEHRALVRGLRSARFTALTSEWRRTLSKLRPARGLSAGDLAAGRIDRARRKVLHRGHAITAQSPPEDLHNLRKRCKELRYLLEFFASLYEPRAYQSAVKELKGLQDCLGEFQDGQVQEHEIRFFAGQMLAGREAPVTAILAMGELAGQVAAGQRRAREQFAGRFSEFASPEGDRRFHALTGVTL
ncbi:MAG TPA: CHAD domain-containing protein [Streptosporangiaceae bacterium]|nr:CHAD domain-containing protein [Streptosporangiaceae bacterium]